MEPRYFTAEQTGIILQRNSSTGILAVAKLLWGLSMKQFSKLLAQRQIKTLLIASGHKRVHGIKFQSSPIPNGLICILSCPYLGKRHDSVMFMSQGCSQIYRDQYDIINPICGDQTYPLSIHLQAPFFRQNLTPNPVNYNGCSNEIKTYFKFVSVNHE